MMICSYFALWTPDTLTGVKSIVKITSPHCSLLARRYARESLELMHITTGFSFVFAWGVKNGTKMQPYLERGLPTWFERQRQSQRSGK